MVCECPALGGLLQQVLRLNPCFNGIWSASLPLENGRERDSRVLILVLMEYGLRGSIYANI